MQSILENTQLRSLTLVCASITAALLFAGAAAATPLNLHLESHPDIASSFIDVTYDAGTDALVASGLAAALYPDNSGVFVDIIGGQFELAATVLSDGSATGGSLSITGSVPGSGPSLLTGVLVDFGFHVAAGGPLEFIFQVTGGDLAPLYGGLGAAAAVILSETGFGGSFASDFDNLITGPGSSPGVSNTGVPVPEPSSFMLMTLGLLALRRRN